MDELEKIFLENEEEVIRAIKCKKPYFFGNYLLMKLKEEERKK